MKSIPSKRKKRKNNPPSTDNKRGRRVGFLSQHIDLPAFLRWLQADGLLSLRDCKELTGISASVVSRLIATEPDRPVPIQACAAEGCFMTITQRNKDEYCCKACRSKTAKVRPKGTSRPKIRETLKALPTEAFRHSTDSFGRPTMPAQEAIDPRCCADRFCQNELRHSNKSGFCSLHTPRWKKAT